MKYKAVIFDLDGTLLDTLQDLTNAVNYALVKLGFPLRSKEEVRCFIGDGIRKLIERSLPNSQDKDIINIGLGFFKEHYETHCMDCTRPYNGILDLLKQLQLNGIKISIVSNKADFAVKKLSNYFFKGIDLIAIGESEKVKRKPCPDALLKVVNDLNIKVNDCVYVGDSDIDIDTANNANMDCISVSWGFRDVFYLKQHGAKIVVSNTEELLQAINK